MLEAVWRFSVDCPIEIVDGLTGADDEPKVAGKWPVEVAEGTGI